VIVRRTTLDAKYPGGFDLYRAEAPNATFRYDDHLAAVGFMSPHDVGHFVDLLGLSGLNLVGRVGAFDDIAVVDQNQSPTMQCDWLTVYIDEASGHPAAALAGAPTHEPPATHPGFKPGAVFFRSFSDVARLELQGVEEGGVGSFLDPASGEMNYMGSPYGDLEPRGAIAAAVLDYLVSAGLRYRFDEVPLPAIHARIRSTESYGLRIHPFDDRGQLLVFLYIPLNVGSARWHDLVLFANEVNLLWTIGDLQVDATHEVIRVRVSLGDVGLQGLIEPTPPLAGALIQWATSLADSIHPVLALVGAGEIDVETAVTMLNG
jgi:hypothetical protein